MMKIQQFNGGLSTVLRPQFLELTEAVEYTNIDNAVGTLASVKTKVATAISASAFNYFFDVEGVWFGSGVRRDYVSFQGELYWTDGTAPKEYRTGDTYNLGIAAPTSEPVATPSEILEDVTTANFEVSQAGDLPIEKVFYKYVNFNGDYYSDVRNISVNIPNSRVENLDRTFRDLNFAIRAVVPTTASVELFPPEGLEYGSDGVQLYRQYKDKWRLLGTFTDPGVGPIQSITDDVYDISANAELDETKLASVVGDMQYVYTFYNSVTGRESAPSPISVLKEAKGIVTLTGLQVSSDPQVDTRRIYRVGGNITTFTLVEEIDNTVTSYVDSVKDSDLDGRLLNSTLNTPAPSELKYLTESNAMLFGAEGSKLRFTPVGQPAYWPEVYFLEFYNDITGIGVTASGLLVFTKYKTYIVYGTGPTLLSSQLLDGEQGCLAHASVQQVGSAVMWVSTDGICVSNGSPAQVISQNKLGPIGFDIVDSVVHDQVYYLIGSEGQILAHDYRYNRIFKRLSLGVTSFAKANDKLYGVANGVLNELFKGSELEEFYYKSPRFIEGLFSEDKTYKKVYIYAAGDIIINIFINDLLVFTDTLTGTKKHEIQIDQSKQRGNYIQLEFKGKGEVLEYEYVVGRGHGHA